MSGAKSKDAVIQIINRLLEIYNSIVRKETGDCSLPKLKEDLVDFRDVLTEFIPILTRYAIDSSTNIASFANNAKIFVDIMGTSYTNTRDFVNQSLLLTELSSQADTVRNCKTIATLVTTSMVGNGFITSVKTLKEILQKIS